MTQVIVCNIEDAIKAGLEARASKCGWRMEEEVRLILRRAVGVEGSAQSKLGSRIAARFADVGLTEPLPEL